jgi:Rhodopirellula transposase DDE domain
VLHEHTAGSPTQPEVIWTDLTATDIAEKISQRGNPISVHIVEQLLDEHDYHRRKAQKSLSLREHKDRDQQFGYMARLTQQYLECGEPILSMDTKKRELIGNFFRPGVLLSKEAIQTLDHDFPSFAEGVVIPHGLYDERHNKGYVHLGTSHDTSAFACDCLLHWWGRFGQKCYPGARSLLLKCDGGGSNSAKTYLFKAEAQRLADETGLEIRVAHYPPYCSKYNPIEHRLFCHISRACQGVIFTSVELVRQLMEKTRTRTGLSVVVEVIDKVYPTGRKVADEIKKSLNLVRDHLLPNLNYRLLPRT